MALFVAFTQFVPDSGAQGTLSTMILEDAPYLLLNRTYHARRGVQAEHEVRDITQRPVVDPKGRSAWSWREAFTARLDGCPDRLE